jgi:kumamolisin
MPLSVTRLAVCALTAAAGLSVVGAATASGAPVVARVLVGLDRDEPGLVAHATRVSDPESRSYRAYESVRALARRFGASDATVARARSELARAGVRRSSLDVTRGFLIVPVTASQLSRLQGGAQEAGRTAGAAGGVIGRRRPDAITEIVVDAPRLLPAARASRSSHSTSSPHWPPNTGTPRGCAKGVATPLDPDGGGSPGATAFTPNQFQVAFGLTPLHRAGVQGQGQHIALFQSGAGVKRADARTFARCFGLPEPNMRIVPVGTPRPLDPDIAPTTQEALLDVQAVQASAPRARITVVEGGGRTSWPEVLSAALDERRMRGLPDVLSISYGYCERAVQGGGAAPWVGGPGARRLADWVMATAAGAGTSVIAAAGDSGAAACAHAYGGVPAGPGMASTVADATANWVAYPASSPWATAVGGTTMVLRRDNTIWSQAVWNDQESFGFPAFDETTDDGQTTLDILGAGGGGGTSLVYATPPWQASAGIVSPRRAVPDVSMYARKGIVMVCSAHDPATGDGPCPPGDASWPYTAVGGTSYSAPFLAGVVALANQRASAAGVPRAGFLSPLLYSPGARPAIRDVRTGSNDVFGTGRCCFAGPGYDQASGLGTVNAARLADAVVRAGR